jgi:formylglycine-generating enzyme
VRRGCKTRRVERCCTPTRQATGAVPVAPDVVPVRAAAQDLVTIATGTFSMGDGFGDGDPGDGETPVHQVTVAAFEIAATTVTNDEFATFCAATGYVTLAEREGWSFVFAGLLPDDFPPTRSVVGAPWWRQVEGADWRHPDGPHTDVATRGDHPVVHVTWHDAMAYCEWSGTRLPTEAEWERAARGGLVGRRFPWGDDLEPGGDQRMNVFQGTFPGINTCADGYAGTAPVRTYAPNGFGLYQTTGNVWEWCADWFHPQTYTTGQRTDPRGPTHGSHRVMRGGSYLCHHSYCTRYRVAARSANTSDSAAGNIGFRVARSCA